MNLNKMRWFDYIFLVLFLAITGYISYVYNWSLFAIRHDDSGFLGVTLLVNMPIAFVSTFAFTVTVIKFIRRKKQK